jgi:hypothetical protein
MGVQVSDIHFSWAGRNYIVKAHATGKEHIVLPNRKVLRPVGWLFDGGTPQLLKADEVIHHLEHASVGEIAEHFGNAILAHEAD